MDEQESEGITLHFPFKWLRPPEPADTTFKYEDDRPERFQYVCHENGEAYIEVSDLPNWPCAEQMVFRCRFGLLCYSAMKHRPHKVVPGIAEIDWIDDIRRPRLSQMFKEDLEGVDGIVVGPVPYIYSHKSRIKRTRFGLTFKTAREDGESIAEELVRSCVDSRFYDLAADKKLVGALEMANLINTDAPKLARFVLLVSALEALMPESEVSKGALEKISAWEVEAKELGLDELANLQSLRYPSIARRFRKLASSFPPASVMTKKERRAYEEELKRAYDCRSQLVHEGTCDEEVLTKVYPTVYYLLQRVLADRLKWT